MTTVTVTVADLADITPPEGIEIHWSGTCRRADRAIIRSINDNVAWVQYLRRDGDYSGLISKMPTAHIVKTYSVEMDARTGNLITA
jgi:hypothetical protein